jgi:hypothetical protein
LELLDLVGKNLGSVIPESIVDPLSDELKRRMRTEGVLLGHVQVVDEADCLGLSILRTILVLGTSLKVGLNDLLSNL